MLGFLRRIAAARAPGQLLKLPLLPLLSRFVHALLPSHEPSACMQTRYASSCTYPHSNPGLKLKVAPDPSYSVPIFTGGEELSGA